MASTSTSSSSQTTIQDNLDTTLSWIEKLNRLLPTGMLFLYQILSPVLSNDGHCSKTIHKYLTATLVSLCLLFCFISSFTDSYHDNGKTYYGFPTRKGNLWPWPKNNKYTGKKLNFGDFIHGVFAVIVFGVLVAMDRNTVGCFYPGSESSQRTLLELLPPIVGAVSSIVFLLFPNNRHGIGYNTSRKSSKDKPGDDDKVNVVAVHHDKVPVHGSSWVGFGIFINPMQPPPRIENSSTQLNP